MEDQQRDSMPKAAAARPEGSIGDSSGYSFLLSAAKAILIVLLINAYLFQFILVSGSSMAETLHSGDVLLVSKLEYVLGEPARFDIVICKYPKRRDRFVKRVVGLPGERISVLDGVLYVNGKAYAEEYIQHRPNYTIQDYMVPDGHYFVLGDNRSNSNDSHSIGPIARGAIVGKARAVLFPFRHMKWLSNNAAYHAAAIE